MHLLIDDLDGLANHVSSASRALADVAVGVGAFNKLSYYNDTVEMLRVTPTNASALSLEILVFISIVNLETYDSNIDWIF